MNRKLVKKRKKIQMLLLQFLKIKNGIRFIDENKKKIKKKISDEHFLSFLKIIF